MSSPSDRLAKTYPYVPLAYVLRGDQHPGDKAGWSRLYDPSARPHVALLFAGITIAFGYASRREFHTNPTVSLLSLFVAMPLALSVWDETVRCMQVIGHLEQ